MPLILKFFHPRYVAKWFSNYIKKLIDEKTVWFIDEMQEILNGFQSNILQDPNLLRYQANDPNFGIVDIINIFFKNSILAYRPILIPPKRFLEAGIKINLGQKVEPMGNGIVNRLFYLKNQLEKTEQFNTFQRVQKSFTDITNYYFDINPNISDSLEIFFSKDKNTWFLANDSGLGLSDILVMVVFSLDLDYSFVFIEEPESHLHPEMQSKFLNFLKTIKNKQFILSTHANTFLNPYIVDRAYYIEFKDGVYIDDKTSKSKILYNLGYSVSDNIVSDVIVLTEGLYDRPVLEEICLWLDIFPRYNIKFWPLGGDNMAELDLSVIGENKNVIALIDNDPGSKVSRTRFEKNCKDYEIHCHRLKKYSIENYFTIKALKEIFNNNKELDKVKEIDPNKSVDEQIGFKEKNKTIKYKNKDIIRNMTIEDIKDTDLYKFCLEIKKLCESLK